jgi:hypothetical protein
VPIGLFRFHCLFVLFFMLPIILLTQFLPKHRPSRCQMNIANASFNFIASVTYGQEPWLGPFVRAGYGWEPIPATAFLRAWISDLSETLAASLEGQRRRAGHAMTAVFVGPLDGGGSNRRRQSLDLKKLNRLGSGLGRRRTRTLQVHYLAGLGISWQAMRPAKPRTNVLNRYTQLLNALEGGAYTSTGRLERPRVRCTNGTCWQTAPDATM